MDRVRKVKWGLGKHLRRGSITLCSTLQAWPHPFWTSWPEQMVDLIHHDYTWPGLCEFVKKYCKSCTTCMHSKPQHHKPYGLLKQLPMPECPWNSISMDFIETLPTSTGCDSILVIVDQLSKQGIFIPTTIHCTSEDLVILFLYMCSLSMASQNM